MRFTPLGQCRTFTPLGQCRTRVKHMYLFAGTFHYPLFCDSTGPAVGMASERFGERPIGMLGAGLATIGLVISSFSTEVDNTFPISF